jgi:Predicted transcriptional regulator
MSKIPEVSEVVRGLLNAGYTQESLAAEFGVNQSTVARWLKGAEPGFSTMGALFELAAERGVIGSDHVHQAPLSDLKSIPEIDLVAGLGGGGFAVVEATSANGITFAKEVVRDHWRIPDWMLSTLGVASRHVAAFRTQGDSMTPTIRDGDVVFIDTRHRVPSPPGIYAVADEFGGVILKRLEVTSKPSDETITVRISSDNPHHRERELTIDEIHIVGRYIGRFTI